MLEKDYKILNYNKENKVIVKSINLDGELDLFLLISSEDKNFGELVLEKIVDLAVDEIKKENSYKDFASVLESINTTIKTWRQDNTQTQDEITILIGLLNKNNFLFSNIGGASAYLIKNTNEVIEVTEKEEKKRLFNFISDGKLDYGDTIILSTTRLLNYLSYSDFTDSSVGKKAEALNKNIETILDEENIDENIGILSFSYNFLDETTKNSKIKEKVNDFSLKLLDNKLTKKLVAYYMLAKDFISKQNKSIKNLLYVFGIISSIVVLFLIIDSIVGVSIDNKTLETNINNLKQAREYIRLANQNPNNPDIFELNIKKAEDIIKQLREKNIFSNDVEQISKDLAIIKKQFNGIETFIESPESLVFQNKQENAIKVLKAEQKLYLVTQKSIIGPIFSGKQAENYVFNDLKQDSFIDATDVGESIILITKNGKVVEFSKNGYFSYKDVKDQKTWEESSSIVSYNKNIYLISKEKNQIIKHSKSGNDFNKGIDYLKPEDSASIGKILDIAIDGGIYILKDNLSIVKLYSSPYRLESIVINKLPKDYEKQTENIKIKARGDLNYVYILLNNKIWIFQPNTKNPYSTKSLTYVGQIEGGKYKILEFYVDYDGRINVLNEDGIYKLNFEVSDGKLIVR